MNADLLIHYEAIDAATVDMLDAARAGAWDRVIEIEAACLALIARLAQVQAGTPAAVECKRKSLLMQRLVVRDAEIRRLAHSFRDDTAHGWPDRPAVLH